MIRRLFSDIQLHAYASNFRPSAAAMPGSSYTSYSACTKSGLCDLAIPGIYKLHVTDKAIHTTIVQEVGLNGRYLLSKSQ
jgi:hypothetical protein